MCWRGDDLRVGGIIIIIANRCLRNYDIFLKSLYDEIRKYDGKKRDDDDRNDSACKCSVTLLLFIPLERSVCKNITLKDDLFKSFHCTILILINDNIPISFLNIINNEVSRSITKNN